MTLMGLSSIGLVKSSGLGRENKDWLQLGKEFCHFQLTLVQKRWGRTQPTPHVRELVLLSAFAVPLP